MKKIKEFDNKLVSNEILERIEESEYVCGFETLGCSNQYLGATWFDVVLIDGVHIDVFCNV